MKRRTRITLAAATLTLAALGGTYGLVAQQPIPSASSTTVAAATVAPVPSTGTSSAVNGGATRSVLPPVTHTRTRAS
jgi:hypothetical protein